MFITILFSSVFLQCLCYWYIDDRKLRVSKTLVLLMLLLVYIFLLPYIFYPEEEKTEGFRCGLPIMAMFGAFWILGAGATMVAHVAYYCVKGILRKG